MVGLQAGQSESQEEDANEEHKQDDGQTGCGRQRTARKEEANVNQSQTDYQTLQEQRSIRRRLVLLGTGALIYLFVVMAVALWRGSNSHAGPTATAPVAVNR